MSDVEPCVHNYAPMDAAGGYEELAPTGAGRAPAQIFSGALVVIGVMVGLIDVAGGNPPNLGVFLTLSGAAMLGYLWLWPAKTRLLTGPGFVGYQNLFMQRTFWSTSDISRTVELTIVYYAPRSGYQSKPYLLLVGADGRCLRKIRRSAWTDEAIRAFEAATGRAAEYAGVYRSDQAGREFPGSVGWMYAHPSASLAITGGVAVAIGVLVVVGKRIAG
jgi:hypothetical protein